jgi:D-beta-D-heptose 7-phosphate kinase/D-beta-D-heptose 1-phosphate adenosyltransferase
MTFSFVATNILVIGDVMLDKYIIGNVNRISPEAPVPIVNVFEEKITLGGSANVAYNLACLGINSHSLGAIGNDQESFEIVSLIKEKKIGDSLFKTSSIPTTVKTRVIGERQQLVRLDRESFFTENNDLLSHLQIFLNEGKIDLIIISDYNKGVCSSDICINSIEYAQNNNIKIIIDPKGKDWEKYRGAYIVTPNLKELQDIAQTKIDNNDIDVEYIGKRILNDYGFENILITRSEKGMTLIEQGGLTTHFHAKAQTIYDVSGAGDTVVATLAASLSSGLDLKKSVEIANIAAGIVVGKLGTSPIMLEELNNY